MPRRIGVSGFLISCATWRAISPHASTRWLSPKSAAIRRNAANTGANSTGGSPREIRFTVTDRHRERRATEGIDRARELGAPPGR